MGPIVQQGFVAGRIQRLQEAQSNPGQASPPRTPKAPHPISERVQTNEPSSSPEPNPVAECLVHRTRSFGPVTPEEPESQLTSYSFSEERWIKSSPSTPVIRGPTGAALYWDRKIQSLRHPPTREALEIRRFRRGQRSYENVRQTKISVSETPSRHRKDPPHPEERDGHNTGPKDQRGHNRAGLISPQAIVDYIPRAQSSKPSTANDMDDMIHHIDRALQGRYDSSTDMTMDIQAADSHQLIDGRYDERSSSPRRRLFNESPSADGRSLSDILSDVRSASHRESLDADVSCTDNRMSFSGHKPGLAIRDRVSQGGTEATTETLLPRNSSGTGWCPTGSCSSPDGRPQTWHPDHLDAVHQFPAPNRIRTPSHTPAPAVITKFKQSPKAPRSTRLEASERHESIPKEPKSVQPTINDHYHSIPDRSVPFSRQPSGMNRKASVSSIRSASSQGSRKWRWWKLALVDKQPKSHEPRKRQSTPQLREVHARAKEDGHKDEGTATPYLPVETILETEAEREHASIDEVLVGSPASKRPAAHSPSLAEVQTQRSNQWVADLPHPGSRISESASLSRRGSELRASVEPEVKKRDQRIKKVQVIVSLDGASDLVVEASLERKRRKSWTSGD